MSEITYHSRPCPASNNRKATRGRNKVRQLVQSIPCWKDTKDGKKARAARDTSDKTFLGWKYITHVTNVREMVTANEITPEPTPDEIREAFMNDKK
jgi:hypothetical protein